MKSENACPASNASRSVVTRLARIILFSLLSTPIFYILFVFFIGLSRGYTTEQMDWDNDGNTIFIEILATADIGKMNSRVDGQDCEEFYAFKDGQTIKTICPRPNAASTSPKDRKAPL
jgi:hypothetical protein